MFNQLSLLSMLPLDSEAKPQTPTASIGLAEKVIASWDKVPSCARGQHLAEWFKVGSKVRYLGSPSELHQSDRGTVTRIDVFPGGSLMINVKIGKYIFAISPKYLEAIND